MRQKVLSKIYTYSITLVHASEPVLQSKPVVSPAELTY